MSYPKLLIEREALVARLAIKLAPMLANKKPAVLITLKSKKDEDFDVLINSQRFIKRILSINFKIIHKYENKNLVLFYRKKELEKFINEKWRNRYFKKIGYSSCSELDDFLNKLVVNFSEKSFPHEIGIFLGYPLKDVIGFIEHKSKAPKTKGTMWKIYGCPDKSLMLMNSYKQISSKMEDLLKTNSIFNINYINFKIKKE